MDTKQDARRAKLARFWRDDVRPLLILAAILFSLRSSLADWNDVPSGSMKPTILEGDRIFVNKLAYDLKFPFTTRHLAEWSNPARGEVAVFYSPHDEVRLVKRVVGVPGDTLEMSNGRLILNGQPLAYENAPSEALEDLSPTEKVSRSYGLEQLPGKAHAVAATPWVQSRRNFGSLVIPEGHFFMMGDNRDESFDSRYFGLVERRRIIGRAQAIVFSLDRENFWMPRLNRLFESL
jgi:signal peptidase I